MNRHTPHGRYSPIRWLENLDSWFDGKVLDFLHKRPSQIKRTLEPQPNSYISPKMYLHECDKFHKEAFLFDEDTEKWYCEDCNEYENNLMIDAAIDSEIDRMREAK